MTTNLNTNRTVSRQNGLRLFARSAISSHVFMTLIALVCTSKYSGYFVIITVKLFAKLIISISNGTGRTKSPIVDQVPQANSWH